MKDYINPEGGADWPVFALGAIVGLLVMVGVSYLTRGFVATAAGIAAAVMTYGYLARPEDKRGK